MKPSRRSTPPLCLILALGSLIVGCGTSVTVDRSFDPEEGTVSHSTSIGRQSELERADGLVREGVYDDAIAIYRTLYRSAPDRDVKAQALHRWARAESNLFNADRDPDQAIARLELWLEEFPDHALRQQVEQDLQRLRSQRSD